MKTIPIQTLLKKQIKLFGAPCFLLLKVSAKGEVRIQAVSRHLNEMIDPNETQYIG